MYTNFTSRGISKTLKPTFTNGNAVFFLRRVQWRWQRRRCRPRHDCRKESYHNAPSALSPSFVSYVEPDAVIPRNSYGFLSPRWRSNRYCRRPDNGTAFRTVRSCDWGQNIPSPLENWNLMYLEPVIDPTSVGAKKRFVYFEYFLFSIRKQM